MTTLGPITHHGQEMAVVETGAWANGLPVIDLMDANGERWSRLSLNVDMGTDTLPTPSPIALIKTWGENEQVRESLLACGVFADTGERIPSGYVQIEVWAINR